jgi:hypothetical protein
LSDEFDADNLPSELRAFLHSCIESIEQIELLILMRGSEHFRTARDVANALREPIGTARRDLETLAARGLLDVFVGEETAYRYRPKSVELGRYVDLVAQYYVTSRNSILRFVTTESRLAAKRFAEAFRLRDKE